MTTESRKQYDRRRYLERKQEGLCAKHGCFNEPIEGEVLCDYHKSYQEERYQENRAKGLCRCGRERSGNLKNCEFCLNIKRKYKVRINNESL